MFYTKDLEGNIGEGRVGAFPITSSAARVSTVSIGIDGVLSNHFSCLYREAVYASPSLLFSSSPEDTILQIAEGFVIGSDLFRSALANALETPDYYCHLPICDAVTHEDFKLLDDAFESAEVAGYLISGRACLAHGPSLISCDTRVATQNWLHHHGLRHYLGVIPCVRPKDLVQTLQDRLIDFHLTAVPGVVDMLSAAGVETYLLDRSWNRNHATARRVFSIEQFLDIVYNHQYGARLERLERAS